MKIILLLDLFSSLCLKCFVSTGTSPLSEFAFQVFPCVRAVHYNQLVNKYRIRIQYNPRRKLVATMLDITDTTSCVRFKFKSVQYDYMLKNTLTFTQVKTEQQ